MRVASRMAAARVNDAQHTSSPATTTRVVEAAPAVPAKFANRARAAGVGTRRFSQAFFGPFARVSSILWSEITGVFFALFALFFALGVYRMRAAWSGGPDRGKLLLCGVLALSFTYFFISSFYRARRKEKAKR